MQKYTKKGKNRPRLVRLSSGDECLSVGAKKKGKLMVWAYFTPDSVSALCPRLVFGFVLDVARNTQRTKDKGVSPQQQQKRNSNRCGRTFLFVSIWKKLAGGTNWDLAHVTDTGLVL
jgi:hypothetical protein